MKESTRQILDILEKAVESERHFQREYSKGASLAEDPKVKETFLRLVEDEMEHERILTERYQALKGKPLILEPEEGSPPAELRWEHDITVYTMADIEAIKERLGFGPTGPSGSEETIFCDHEGICFFDGSPDSNVEVLKSVLNARGADGWDLIQLDYRRERLICTWKRKLAGSR